MADVHQAMLIDTCVSIFLTVNNDAIKLSAEVLYVFILGKYFCSSTIGTTMISTRIG